jgi:uncharacterized protein
MPNPVVHFEIISPEAPKLQQFYRDIFGWKITIDNPFNYGMVDTCVDGGIDGGIGAPVMGGAGHLTFYIAVASIDEALARITAAGGKVALPKMTVPPAGPVLAHFLDPAGHRIGLIETGSVGGG